jgi:hypothetical protein
MKLLYALIVISLAIGAGCKSDSNKTSTSTTASASDILSGNGQRTWRSTKETDSQGDKERLDREEKKEFVTFMSNGNFTMGSQGQSRQGTWKHEGSTLVMQFTGEGVSENFTVLELDNNTLRLRAAEGSEMTMKPE